MSSAKIGLIKLSAKLNVVCTAALKDKLFKHITILTKKQKQHKKPHMNRKFKKLYSILFCYTFYNQLRGFLINYLLQNDGIKHFLQADIIDTALVLAKTCHRGTGPTSINLLVMNMM